jgi:hypothetical protein
MNDSKIVMDIKQLDLVDGKKNYEALVLNEDWSKYFNNIYEMLVQNNTGHLKLKGFRDPSKIPLVLFEIKYQDYFDKLKNESLQYTLAMVNMSANDQLKSKNTIKSFKIQENTNDLLVLLEEITEEIKQESKEEENNNINLDKNNEVVIDMSLSENNTKEENKIKKTPKKTKKS